MIPGSIVGWHVNAKIPTQVDGYRVNEQGEPQPYTTIVSETPGYNTERERIARVIAASEEAEDLILTLQRMLPRDSLALHNRCQDYLESIQ